MCGELRAARQAFILCVPRSYAPCADCCGRRRRSSARPTSLCRSGWHRCRWRGISAWSREQERPQASDSWSTATCCGTRPATSSPTTATTHARSRITWVIGRLLRPCATPPLHRIASSTSGGTEEALRDPPPKKSLCDFDMSTCWSALTAPSRGRSFPAVGEPHRGCCPRCGDFCGCRPSRSQTGVTGAHINNVGLIAEEVRHEQEVTHPGNVRAVWRLRQDP